MQLWRSLTVGGESFEYVSLKSAEEAGVGPQAGIPFAIRVLIENVLRQHGDDDLAIPTARALARRLDPDVADIEVPFRPGRILMPDSSGLPLLADLAAIRAAVEAGGGDPRRVNPSIPLDLVVDHSAVVDVHGTADAARRNLAIEFERNIERYGFLRWAEGAFEGLRVVPPGNGICHQINLEFLASVVSTAGSRGRRIAFPDTLVGTDSHTPMIGGLGVLGWGVGGIEAATAMLGEPIGLRIPRIVGCRLVGKLGAGVTTTDLVLTITQRLRAAGVVGTIVEFCGQGLDRLTLPQRATLCNMAPEYGATTAFVPIDAETIRFLRTTGRAPARIALVEAYAREQGLWRESSDAEPLFDDLVDIDLSTVEPSAAGPGRPQDRMALAAMPASFRSLRPKAPLERSKQASAGRLCDGDIVIAAITSCTNTSNPSVIVAAGLLARNAVARGLAVKPWVKTSLAPGSRVVGDYLAAAGLQEPLDALGFQIVGHGCTTCMGASGPLAPDIARAVVEDDVLAVAVISGNRNFEGRIHSQVRANYLVSPPLVVAYAIAGSVLVDLTRDPLGRSSDGTQVYLRDIWPDDAEIDAVIARRLHPELYRKRYADGFAGAERWTSLTSVGETATFPWNEGSTYIRRPPFLDGVGIAARPVEDIMGARPLLILGDGVTTDHISPVSAIAPSSQAGRYLRERGVDARELSSYMARRVNHDVMLRGTFDHPRLRNELVGSREGGFTRLMPGGSETTVFEAAQHYAKAGTPLIVVAGADYGAGSSRDWAAKGTRLLGIRAVLAESFERIHRANLVGMGVLPLTFPPGTTRRSLGLTGAELFDIRGLADIVGPGQTLACTITRPDGTRLAIELRCRVDTAREADWYRQGGILAAALRKIA